MKIIDHSFANRDAEYDLIKEFLLQVQTYPAVDDNWDPGRMDWWRYNVHARKAVDFFQANAHYWKTEANQVVGLFISEYGDDDFFLLVHPEYATLFSTVLNWGLQVWARGKPRISTSVLTHDRRKVAQLIDAGFYENGHESNIRTYALRGYDVSYTLKPGFRLLSFLEYGDYESRVKLVRNAFESTSYSEANLRSLQRSPTYLGKLDLVIVDAQGESVAYCMGWIEEDDPSSGYVEPMGTHTDYRRNGFATALAKECFKRLRDLGVERVNIASHAEPHVANCLYDSLHPVSIRRAYRYTMDLSKARGDLPEDTDHG